MKHKWGHRCGGGRSWVRTRLPSCQNVEARDEVVVANVAFGWCVPSFGNLTEVFFQVGDDILEAGDL